MTKGMKILITGAAGFMGSHLVESLIKEGLEVHGVDDLSGGYIENVSEKCFFKKLDLRDKEKTYQYINEIKPEIIYHLAATAREGASHFDPINMVERNIMAYVNLIEPAIKNGLKKIILTSSMAVYGKQKPPFSEKLKRKPVDIYGSCKSCMEEITEDLAYVHDFNYTIIRPHNVYGPKQSLSDKYRNVIGIWINSLMREENINIYGDGTHTRAFSYIDDVTPYLALSGMLDNCNQQIINLGGIKEYTLNELAKIVLEEFFETKDIYPYKNLIRFLPDRIREVPDAYCTYDKSVEILGFKQNIDLRVGVKRMIQWAKAKGPQEWVDYKLPLFNKKAPCVWE